MINISSEIRHTANGEIMFLLNEYVRPGDTVLDVGCGDKCYVFPNELKAKYLTIDAWEKAEPDYLIDLERQDLPFEENSIDVVQMFDVIEHIDKDRGREILEQAKRICIRNILLLTPSIFKENDEEKPKSSWHRGNPFNRHKCLWMPDEFTDGWFGKPVFSMHGTYYLGVWTK